MKLSSPTLPKNRITQIDILRGFALFGILIVNSLGYNASFFNWSGFYNSTFTDVLSVGIFNSVVNFCSDKFIFMFSLLFGFGFALMYEKHSSDEKGFVSLYTRRLLALLLFGALHIVFLWAGDILFWYALCGFLLLLLRKAKSWQLLVLSVLFYFIGVAYIAMQAVIPSLPDAMSSTANIDFNTVIDTYRNGTIAETIKLRLYEYYSFRNINLLYYVPKVMALFLFGYWCHRKNMINKINGNKLCSIIIAAILLTAGIFVNKYTMSLLGIFTVEGSPFVNAVYMLIYEINNIFLGFSYILIILVLSKVIIFSQILKPLQYAGRMALTNYLLQSLIFIFIMYSWGLGYFASFTPCQCLIMTVCVFACEILFSWLWLKRFSYGPMEWIWRKLTYGTLQNK